GGLLDPRVGDVVDADVALAVPGQGLHRSPVGVGSEAGPTYPGPGRAAQGRQTATATSAGERRARLADQLARRLLAVVLALRERAVEHGIERRGHARLDRRHRRRWLVDVGPHALEVAAADE